MILADKIIENRKRNGWSQEELADRLGVSRQSVSKWESAQSVPDMKRILQLAELFGVTTDYLLKDEINTITTPDPLPVEPIRFEEDEIRTVSMEEASTFLSLNEKSAMIIANGVLLCILSPVILILLSSFAEAGRIGLAEDRANALGLGILLAMVACAVGMFLLAGFRGKPYEYLEKVKIETAYGVTGMVRERKNNYAPTHTRLLTIGILLCVIAAIPMLMVGALHLGSNTLISIVGEPVSICIMLVLIAIGVRLIVQTCVRQGGFDRLLEEGDYTRINKRLGKYDTIYWCLVTALYLGTSFLTEMWDRTWIIWPVAGVLFAVYREILKMRVR